jgi:hypothetical protein
VPPDRPDGLPRLILALAGWLVLCFAAALDFTIWRLNR